MNATTTLSYFSVLAPWNTTQPHQSRKTGGTKRQKHIPVSCMYFEDTQLYGFPFHYFLKKTVFPLVIELCEILFEFLKFAKSHITLTLTDNLVLSCLPCLFPYNNPLSTIYCSPKTATASLLTCFPTYCMQYTDIWFCLSQVKSLS